MAMGQWGSVTKGLDVVRVDVVYADELVLHEHLVGRGDGHGYVRVLEDVDTAGLVDLHGFHGLGQVVRCHGAGSGKAVGVGEGWCDGRDGSGGEDGGAAQLEGQAVQSRQGTKHVERLDANNAGGKMDMLGNKRYTKSAAYYSVDVRSLLAPMAS
jgi:hypothetical protein